MTTQSSSCCSMNHNNGHIIHYSTSMKLQVAAIVFLMSLGKGLSFNCYSCSYTRSSDPSVNYGCVTSPQNFTVGLGTIHCTVPYLCITKTLYNQDMTHIRSVTRNCQIQQDMCKGAKCCNEDGVYPSCEYKCRDDRCNDNNPEEHFKLDKTDDGGTGSGNTIIPSSLLMSVLYSIYILK